MAISLQKTSDQHGVYYYFETLNEYFNDKVTDIHINQPGEIFVKEFDKPFSKSFKDEKLTLQWINNFILGAANVAGLETDKQPIISANLNNGEYRLEMNKPPVVKYPALTIRKNNSFFPSVDDLDEQGRFNLKKNKVEKKLNYDNQAIAELDSILEPIKDAIRNNLNIIFFGSTGSGKTTMMNAFIRNIPETERLISIEDTDDINFTQPNHLKLFFKSDNQNRWSTSPSLLFRSCLRHAPDRIFLGELRGAETYDFMDALNSGHPGSYSTFHAGRNLRPGEKAADFAQYRLAKMYSSHEKAKLMKFDHILEEINNLIDVYVYLENANIVEFTYAG